MEVKSLLKIGLLSVFLWACKEEKTEEELPVLREENSKTVSEIQAELEEAGYLTMNYVDEATKDTVIMQQYFIAFLKRGSNRDQPKEVADSLQKLHLEACYFLEIPMSCFLCFEKRQSISIQACSYTKTGCSWT